PQLLRERRGTEMPEIGVQVAVAGDLVPAREILNEARKPPGHAPEREERGARPRVVEDLRDRLDRALERWTRILIDPGGAPRVRLRPEDRAPRGESGEPRVGPFLEIDRQRDGIAPVVGAAGRSIGNPVQSRRPSARHPALTARRVRAHLWRKSTIAKGNS